MKVTDQVDNRLFDLDMLVRHLSMTGRSSADYAQFEHAIMLRIATDALDSVDHPNLKSLARKFLTQE